MSLFCCPVTYDTFIPLTSIENQTHLNFTEGIGTLDYTPISLNNGGTEVSVLTPKEEFLKRIQSEDPLEGLVGITKMM